MLTILSQDYEVLGVLQNKSNSLGYWDDMHIENLDVGAETYEFFTLADHPMSENIQIGNMVAIKNLDDETVLFTIMDIEDDHSEGKFNMKVYCEQAGLQLLNEIEVPYSDTYKPLSFYANKALLWTTWEIGEVESESNLSLTFEENENVYKRLQRIASEFDVEIHFTIEMNGARVTAKKVHFKKQRGNVSGKRFEYTKDITRVFRKRNGYNLITAVKGIGKTDDKGVTTTFKDVVYDDGDFYTEAGSDVIYSRSALERWGRQGGNIWGLFEFDTSNAQNLFTRALRHLKKNINPEITYEVDVVLLERVAGYADEKVRIGDTIRVTDFEFNPPLLLEARVVQLETSYTDPSKDKAILGDYKRIDSTISDELRAIQATLMKREATWSQVGEIILKQPTPPTNPENGDLWLDTSKNPAVIYVYDNPDWIPTSLDPSILEDLQEQITAVEISVNGKETYVPKSATAPSSPTEGMLWLDTSSTPNQLRVYLSGSWESATPDNVYIDDKVQDKVERIQIGSRNYVLDSDRFNVGYFQQFEVVNGFKDFKGKQITISVDVIVKNANLNQTLNRLGYEPAVEFADGTTQYFGVWYYPTQGETGKYRISKTFDFPNKDIVGFPQDGTFIQVTGDYVAVGRPQIEIGNKATDWKPANEDYLKALNDAVTGINGDITDLGSALTDFETEVNGSFRDGLVNEAEVLVIKSYLEQINNEKTSIDSQYNTVYVHVALVGTTEKTNLQSAKSSYDSAHTQLLNSINTVIADGVVTQVERDDITAKFGAYRTALTGFEQRLQQSIDKIGSKKVDDAKTELNKLIDGVEQEVTDLSQALTDFETEVNGTFKDGVISQAEAIVIKAHIQQINNEKSGLDIQYTTVYANTALNSTTEKTNLASAKTAYDTAHTNLVNSINTATTDSAITPAEKADVDAKFVAYRTSLSTLNQRLQQAIDKIGSVRDSQIQVGGENLISNSAPETLTGWDAVPASTGTIEVIDEVTAPLGRALKVTFDATMTGIRVLPNVTLQNSKSYTWSVWIKASKAISMTIGNEKGGTKSVSVTTSWARHEMTFTSSTGANYGMVFTDNLNGMNAGDILYIHSLKLEEGTRATSWSASSREVRNDVQFIRQDINDIYQNTSESAITTTIFNSTKYTEDLAKKANTEDIADMATQTELSETAGKLQDEINKKADNSRVTQAFEQISQVQQTAQDFQFKIQASGGINLLKNSVGYADFKAWTKTGTVQTLVNEDFTKFGSDSVFSFTNGTIEQTALIQKNNFHTLNYVVDKPSTGTLTITIYDGGVSVGSKTYANGTSYSQLRDKITVQALSNALTVQITGTAGQVGVLMLNIGSEPLQWQQAHDEIYTSNVQFDQSGITVKSTAYNGYTVISPDEFAGYAEVIDENGVASIQKIFTLNGDTTEVNKLDVKKQISMGQMKVIDVNGTRKGWAFIKNQ